VEVCLARDVELIFLDCANNNKKLDCDDYQGHPGAQGRFALLTEHEQSQTEKHVQQLTLEEYFPESFVLGDDDERLADLNPGLDFNLFILEHRSQPAHLLLVDQVDDLAAVGDDFKALAGHEDFLLVKQLPVL
jgi:hypothetical protein